MTRLIALIYGILSYALFLATTLYAIGFVTGFAVPKTIDTGKTAPFAEALLNNLRLLSLFAIQHSTMARKSVTQWWTRYVPASVERSTYALVASLTLGLLFWQWQPIPAVIWQIDQPQIAIAVTALSLGGWLMVFTSTFLISAFELFGVRRVINNLTGREPPAQRSRTPFWYSLVRDPIYLGFIIAFWAAPTMTAGRLLFAVAITVYILVVILLEERDPTARFGAATGVTGTASGCC